MASGGQLQHVDVDQCCKDRTNVEQTCTHTAHRPNVASLLVHCLQARLAAVSTVLVHYILLIAFSQVKLARQVTASQTEVQSPQFFCQQWRHPLSLLPSLALPTKCCILYIMACTYNSPFVDLPHYASGSSAGLRTPSTSCTCKM